MIQRRAAVGIVIVAASMLAGCGFEAPDVTSTEHSAVQGTSLSIGPMRVRAAFVTPAISTGGGPLAVSVTFVNDGTASDTLTGVTSPAGTVSLAGPGTTGGQLAIPPGVPVQIEDPALGLPGPTMSVAVKTLPLVGSYVPLTFTFANSGTTAVVQAPVVPKGETESTTTVIPTTQATPPPAEASS